MIQVPFEYKSFDIELEMKNGLKSGMYVKVQVLVHENVTRLFPKSDYMYLVLYVYDIPI